MSRLVLLSIARLLFVLSVLTFAGVLATAEMFEKILPSGTVSRIRDEIWISTSKGVFRFDRQEHRAVPVAGTTVGDYRVVPLADEIWLDSENGVLRFDRQRDRALPVAGITKTSHDVGKNRNEIVLLGDEVWIETAWDGIFRFDRGKDRAVAVAGLAGVDGCHAVRIGNDVWFDTWIDGVFRYDRQHNRAIAVLGQRTSRSANQHVVSVPGKAVPDPRVELYPVGDETWMTSSQGVFRFDRQTNSVLPIAGIRNGSKIESIRGESWIANQDGALRFDHQINRFIPILGITGKVEKIESIKNEIWFTKQEGIFRFDRQTNRAVPILGVEGQIEKIESVNNEIWFTKQEGIFRFDRQTNRAVPIAGVNRAVRQIVPIEHDIWFFGDDGVHRYDRRTDSAVAIAGIARPEQDPQGRIFQTFGETTYLAQTVNRPVVDPRDVPRFVSIGQEIWIENRNEVLRLDPKQDRALPVAALPPNSNPLFGWDGTDDMWLVGGDIWILRSGGLFRVDRQRNQAVTLLSKSEEATSAFPIAGNDALVIARNGIFLWRRDWNVSLSLTASRSWFPELGGVPIWLSGNSGISVRYPTETGRPESVDVIIDASSDELSKKENAKDQNHWSNISELAVELKPSLGICAWHVSLRDSWGNEIHDTVIRGFVLPPWGTVSALLPVLLALLWIVGLSLAPYVRTCHFLLMNPYARKYSSFGIVPILLTTFPRARRHLLKRYRQGVANDPILKKAANSYVVSEDSLRAERFLADLSSRRSVLLYGQSGIGKSAFLQYLAHHCATDVNKHLPIPVLVDLTVFEGVKVKDAVLSQLEKFGDLTDRDLVETFLDHGGFLFLVDGVNEVDDIATREIAQFVDTERNRNDACLTTQVPTQALLRVASPRELSPLSKENVDELVGNLAPNARQLLEQFGEVQYAICSIPLQLELLVEFWASDRRVAKSLEEIFEHALTSVLDREPWKQQGHEDYPDVLCELAFRMIIEKRPYDPEGHELPLAIEQALVEGKWLVPRGDVMEFRHDKVRGYLASRYLSARWKRVLQEPDTVVDSNLDSAIQFHLSQERDSRAARDLLLLLLGKDVETTQRIFAWLRVNRPELVLDWQDEFSLMVGRQVLGLAAEVPPD